MALEKPSEMPCPEGWDRSPEYPNTFFIRPRGDEGKEEVAEKNSKKKSPTGVEQPVKSQHSFATRF